MRLSENKLRRIIKEEIYQVLNEDTIASKIKGKARKIAHKARLAVYRNKDQNTKENRLKRYIDFIDSNKPITSYSDGNSTVKSAIMKVYRRAKELLNAYKSGQNVDDKEQKFQYAYYDLDELTGQEASRGSKGYGMSNQKHEPYSDETTNY